MDYLKKLGLSNTHIYIIIGVVVLVIAGLVYYFYFRNKVDSYEEVRHTQQNIAPPKVNSPPKKTLVLFHSHGCKHCVHLMPVWKEVVETINNDASGTIDVIDFEASQPEARQYGQGIEGLPTIRLFSSGLNSSYIDYAGDRSKMDILKFAYEH